MPAKGGKKKPKGKGKARASGAGGAGGGGGNTLLASFEKLERDQARSAASVATVPDAAMPAWSRAPIAVQELPGRGRGIVAQAPIAPGTTVLVCKPLAFVTDAAVDAECDFLEAAASSGTSPGGSGGGGASPSSSSSAPSASASASATASASLSAAAAHSAYDSDEELGEGEDGGGSGGVGGENADTAVLIMAVAAALARSPDQWARVSQLYPRPEEVAAGRLPPWRADDEAMDARVNSFLESCLGGGGGGGGGGRLGAADLARLKLIVRYNNLSAETNAEQVCYNGCPRFRALAGLGLYVDASYFNHSCKPNVARFSVGDLLVLRTCKHVAAGEELCISYVGADLLCEAPAVRTFMLGGRDFEAAGGGGGGGGGGSVRESRYCLFLLATRASGVAFAAARRLLWRLITRAVRLA
jgi:hypothetical protein